MVKVPVKDKTGGPIGGLRLSMWNILSINGSLYKTENPSLAKTSGTTSSFTVLEFSALRSAQITFSVLNLNDQIVSTFINGPSMAAGTYSIQWSVPATFPSGVYKCRLVATNTSADSLLFQDSVYSVLHNYDPELTVMGWTPSSGIFETSNKLLFPKLINLPPLIHTASNPDSLGTFSYTDSLCIVLTDTNTHKQQSYHVLIGPEANNYDFIWNPPSIPLEFNNRFFNPRIVHHSIDADSVIAVHVPSEWKLMQNYPNPFN